MRSSGHRYHAAHRADASTGHDRVLDAEHEQEAHVGEQCDDGVSAHPSVDGPRAGHVGEESRRPQHDRVEADPRYGGGKGCWLGSSPDPACGFGPQSTGGELPHFSQAQHTAGRRTLYGSMVDVTAGSQRWGSARLDGGGTVAYCLSGSGPPLVVVPGWLSHLELDWAVSAVRAFHLALATGRTLVRYDRPGCGLSEPYEGSRSIELEVAAIRAVTQAARR